MALIKGLNKNASELYIGELPLSALYFGENLIWQKEGMEMEESNLFSSDNLVLISEDGFILMSKDNG